MANAVHNRVWLAFLLVILVLALGLLLAASTTVRAEPDPELASFGALSDGSLSTDFISSKGGIPLSTGVPVVFHSNGSQAGAYPGGFITVAGPFEGPLFDSVVVVLSAHNSAPASATLDFEIRNGTTGEVITSHSGLNVDNIPLDLGASPGAPADAHCDNAADTAGTVFQITLAPPVNEVLVEPTDDLQLIITPTGIFGGAVELCVDWKGFYTTVGLVVEPIPVPNLPPVAALSAPTVVEATSPDGALVTLDASGSSDPDGDPLTYVFSGPFGIVDNGLNPTLEVLLPFSPPSLGSAVSVEVTDDDGESDNADALVTVEDTTAPSLTPPPGIVISADSSCEAAPEDLGAPTTNDAASPPVTVDNDSPGVFPLGETIVTWQATDASGNSRFASQSVTVVDESPPAVSVSVSPEVLSPPNHKLVTVEATVEVTDNCDAGPSVVLTSVTSNEADDGLGDGHTLDDIQEADVGSPDFTFKLRAERSGTGSGRIYTITYEAIDAAGNASTASAAVIVPHSHSP